MGMISRALLLLLSSSSCDAFIARTPLRSASKSLAMRMSMEGSDALDRRALFNTALGLGVTLGAPLGASAKTNLKGTYPADTKGLYTVGVFEHSTPHFKDWHKVLDGFGPDLLTNAYPPDCNVSREIFVKTKGEIPGQEGVAAVLVFKADSLPAVTKFFNEKTSPIILGGRKDGWITGAWHANYYEGKLFRGEGGPPPPLKKGMGVVYGGHGYGGKFEEWAGAFGSPDFDAFHNNLNVVASSAGPSLGKVSTDVKAKAGVGVVHTFKTFKDALAFEAEFDKLWPTLPRDKFQEPKRLVVGEVMYNSDDFIKPF